jgi:hypothetical protein
MPQEPLERRGGPEPLPPALRAGIESLSGHDLAGVRVDENSSLPASVGSLAYTKGSEIHLAPGQEQHLPREAWHAVQQASPEPASTEESHDVPDVAKRRTRGPA